MVKFCYNPFNIPNLPDEVSAMKTNRFFLALLFAAFLILTVNGLYAEDAQANWTVSAIPSSVRLDPVCGQIIENRTDIYEMEPMGDVLGENWVYKNGKVELYSARGEYVSFQLVIGRLGAEDLDDISVVMQAFKSAGKTIEVKPELFLEWSVKVEENSSGYEKSSYGPGWYPDALIPMKCIDMDKSKQGRLWYPLRVPDFRNRIPDQRYQIIWVDQYVPLEKNKAKAGVYESEISVTIGDRTCSIPIELKVWDFSLPNQNRLAGNLQQGGFMKRLDEGLELEIYQLFKRHRVLPSDPTYRPGIEVKDGGVELDWTNFDNRLKKYFTGEAFTEKYGYSGPGYGEPIEQFVLPFDCYRDHRGSRRPGWPDIGDDKEEKKPENKAIYIEAIKEVRKHMLDMSDPDKTRFVVFQGGLDESYFPEAWARMNYYGKMFKEYFPEALYRVDGGYSQEAMEAIHDAIDYWCCHTVGYDLETVEAYRKLGVKDWIYGPMLYEQRANSWVGSNTFIDLELTNERLISWATWKYDAVTWCSWGIGSQWKAAWFSPATWQHASRTEGEDLRVRTSNSNALGVYPPGIIRNVDVPCPTIRLKNMRDGVEEYEYMRLLTELDGSRDRAEEVVNRIVFRPFGKQSVGRLDVWNHNASQWDQARIELGNLIEQKMK